MQSSEANSGSVDGGVGPEVKPHGFVTKGIHWLSAGLIGYGYLKGLDDIAQLAHPSTLQYEIIFALVLAALFCIRLVWNKSVNGVTRLPERAPKWEHFASRAIHIGLYAAVFGIVLSGLGIAAGYSVSALGGVFLTGMIGLHEFTLAALPVILTVHIFGALWHKFIRRDKVLESMTGKLPL